MTAHGEQTRDRTWLVAMAAALWGTDGLLRLPLATAIPPATVVFWEHAIIVLVLLPWLPSAVRSFAASTPRERAAVVGIGVGASALGAALFTAAFAVNPGDPITPLVLQKLQPLFVMVAAYALLGERIRRGYLWFALPALAGTWFLTFADPFAISITAAQSALFALGAAFLWASGTVLGRLAGVGIAPRDLTVLRFAIGLPAAAAIMWVQGDPIAVAPSNAVGLVLLALIPGLIALAIYYYGLRATPAARATLAELAFPATAALIGVFVLGELLTPTQWLGFAAIVAAVTALGWHERRASNPVVSPALIDH